jgi:hypothetical protein
LCVPFALAFAISVLAGLGVTQHSTHFALVPTPSNAAVSYSHLLGASCLCLCLCRRRREGSRPATWMWRPLLWRCRHYVMPWDVTCLSEPNCREFWRRTPHARVQTAPTCLAGTCLVIPPFRLTWLPGTRSTCEAARIRHRHSSHVILCVIHIRDGISSSLYSSRLLWRCPS